MSSQETHQRVPAYLLKSGLQNRLSLKRRKPLKQSLPLRSPPHHISEGWSQNLKMHPVIMDQAAKQNYDGGDLVRTGSQIVPVFQTPQCLHVPIRQQSSYLPTALLELG